MFGSSDFQITSQSGLFATVRRPSGYAVGGFVPADTVRQSSLRGHIPFPLPEVEKSWRPNNRFPFPYPSTRQRSTAENPVPRRIQSLLSGSISTSHPPSFLIVLIPAPGRMRNFPQPARRGQDNIVHLPRRSSSWLSVNYGPADEPSLGAIQPAIALASLSCDSRVIFVLFRQVGTGHPAHFPMRWSREITLLLLNPVICVPCPISTALSLSGRQTTAWKCHAKFFNN